MKLIPKSNCPLNQFNPCKELECAWFIKISGQHPNTGEQIDEWGCSMAWTPILLVDNARRQHSTSVAIESFRNEMIKNNDIGHKILMASANVLPNVEQLILNND